MTKTEFQKFINREIIIKIDGVDGRGNIVWHSASDSWHVVWKETGANAKPGMRITSMTDEIISEIAVVGNDLVLVHPRSKT